MSDRRAKPTEEDIWATGAAGESGRLACAMDIVAHDLRSCVSTIGGYARLLGEGRLPAEERARALDGIQHAVRSVERVGRQAAELSHWLTPCDTRSARVLRLRAVVERVAASPDRSRRVRLRCGPGTESARVVGVEEPLSRACAAFIDAVGRSDPGGSVTIDLQEWPAGGAWNLAFGVPDAGPAGLEFRSDEAGRLAACRRHGLAFVAAVAVIEACQGTWSTSGDRSETIRVSLPASGACEPDESH